MRTEDLKSLSQLGPALWVNAEYSDYVAKETISAVTALELNEERSFEKAIQTLLQRANRDNAVRNRTAFNHPFYRLKPDERFLLAALHIRRWSYARLSRILGLTHPQIGALAWQTRIQLATEKSVPFPAGPQKLGPKCPEYHSTSPWTQKFLDEEHATRERLFIQNHLMVCTTCRMTLARCRDFYFKIDEIVPRIKDEAKLNSKVQNFSKLVLETKTAIKRGPYTFVESIRVFTRRPEVILLISSLALITLWSIFD